MVQKTTSGVQKDKSNKVQEIYNIGCLLVFLGLIILSILIVLRIIGLKWEDLGGIALIVLSPFIITLPAMTTLNDELNKEKHPFPENIQIEGRNERIIYAIRMAILNRTFGSPPKIIYIPCALLLILIGIIIEALSWAAAFGGYLGLTLGLSKVSGSPFIVGTRMLLCRKKYIFLKNSLRAGLYSRQDLFDTRKGFLPSNKESIWTCEHYNGMIWTIEKTKKLYSVRSYGKNLLDLTVDLNSIKSIKVIEKRELKKINLEYFKQIKSDPFKYVLHWNFTTTDGNSHHLRGLIAPNVAIVLSKWQNVEKL